MLAELKRSSDKTKKQVCWWLASGLLLLLLQFNVEQLLPLLRLESDMAFTEPWRLLTCHWLHANWHHFFLNIGSLVAAFSLFPEMLKTSRLVGSLIVCPILVGLCLVGFGYSGAWYVGYSGAFYGLLTMAGVVLFKHNPFVPYALLFVVGKIGWEQLVGPLSASEAILPGQIAIEAHLYGALSGLLLGLLWRFRPLRR